MLKGPANELFMVLTVTLTGVVKDFFKNTKLVYQGFKALKYNLIVELFMSKCVNGLFEEVYTELKKPISIGGKHLSLLGETSRRQCGSLVK